MGKDNLQAETESYLQYTYFFNLMKDFKALGIDVTKELTAQEFNQYKELVNNLYEINEIANLGLPEALKQLNALSAKRELKVSK